MKSRSVLLLMMVLSLAVGLAACGDKKDDKKPAGKSYTVRGKLVSISADGKTAMIQHEKIPAFENAFGETKPMMSMTMGFSVDGASLEGINAGDLIEATFHTDWKAKPALRLDGLTKLPAGTELDLPAE